MKYLGLDLGSRTLGVAVSDKTGLIATTYRTYRHNEEYDKLLDIVKELVDELEIEAIVLGFPKNMNNTIGERANATILFKEKLENKVNIPIVLEDERLTTKIAESTLIRENNLSRKKRKKIIDGTSAVIILQSYLDRRER